LGEEREEKKLNLKVRIEQIRNMEINILKEFILGLEAYC
jgi:hypothetical protein